MDLDSSERAALARLDADLRGAGRRLTRRIGKRRASRRPLWGAGPDNGAPPPGVDVRQAVVVGCDGRPESDAAVRFAFTEAQLRSATVIVVSTFFHPVDPDLESIEIPDSVLQARMHQATERALCPALSRPDYRLPPHRMVIGSGNPARLLLQHYGDAKLIVVGTHHRALIRKLINGPTTGSTLIKRAHIPIVVVPAS
jgi:nucleotide-binding universal stress UspA family protein